jgi:hypothetical protein
MGMLTFESKLDEFTIEDALTRVPGYVDSGDGLYYASTKGIPAKQMGDTIYFAIYAKLSDGTYAYSKLVNYSPITYAKNLLKTGEPSMKALVVAMLNYGAAAQIHFDYNTANLVNSSLTDAQKAMVNSYSGGMVGSVVTPNAAKQGIFANTNGYSKRYPTIGFEGAFSIDYYVDPKYTPVGDVTLYFWNQADFNAASVLTPENCTYSVKMEAQDNGEYGASVKGIAAKQLNDGVYIAMVYSDGTTQHASGVLSYSIGMYCKSLSAGGGTMGALAEATAVYGYYAKAHFGN